MKKKKSLKFYLLIELAAIVIAAILCLSIFFTVRVQAVKNAEAAVFLLNENAYMRTTDQQRARDAVASLDTIGKTSGNEGNVAGKLIFDFGEDESYWLEGNISVLFYYDLSNGSGLNMWDLTKFFDKDDLDKIYEHSLDSRYGTPLNITKIEAEYNEDGKLEPTFIGYGFMYTDSIGKEGKGKTVFEGDKELSVGSLSLFLLPQGEKMRKLLEDPESEGLSNVYTNSVMSGDSMFPRGSEFYRFHDGFPPLLFTIAFDFDGIAWDLSCRQIILCMVYVQGLTLLLMNGIHYYRKRTYEASRLRNSFIDAVAHELKTPAAVVKNTAEYLSTGSRPEKTSHYLEVLQKETTHMNDLLNRMLSYTRVTDTGTALDISDIDLSELFDEVMSTFEIPIKEAGIKTDIRKETKGKKIRGDRTLLKMVIDNLVSNAVKYGSSEKPWVVTIKDDSLTIWNKAGPLPKELTDNIGTPMLLGETSGGMGLAISRGVIERHGGTLIARNEGEGVLFGLELRERIAEKTSRKKMALILVEVILDILISVFHTMQYLEGDDIKLIVVICFLLMAALVTFDGSLLKKKTRSSS